MAKKIKKLSLKKGFSIVYDNAWACDPVENQYVLSDQLRNVYLEMSVILMSWARDVVWDKLTSLNWRYHGFQL